MIYVYQLVIAFVCCGIPSTVELCPCTPSFGKTIMPDMLVRCDGKSSWSSPAPACPIKYFKTMSACQTAGATMKSDAIDSFKCEKLETNQLVPNK